MLRDMYEKHFNNTEKSIILKLTPTGNWFELFKIRRFRIEMYFTDAGC